MCFIAATNFYDGLDRALIREGRFDLHIRIDLPNEDERTRIFDAQLARRPARKFGLQSFAKKTPGWSAAKIGTLVDRAALTLEQHFLKSQLDLLLQTCRRRGARVLGALPAAQDRPSLCVSLARSGR